MRLKTECFLKIKLSRACSLCLSEMGGGGVGGGLQLKINVSNYGNTVYTTCSIIDDHTFGTRK